MQDSLDKQLQYEMDTDALAAAHRLEELRKAGNDGDVDTPRAAAFIARMYAEVQSNIDLVLAVPTKGVGGKFKGWMRAVPSDVAAVLAIRTCIELCTASSDRARPVTIQKLAGKLGKLYELEVLIREAEKVNPVYMEKIHDQIKERDTKSQSHIRKVYSVAYKRVMKGELDSRINDAESMHLGKFGVQACMSAGLIEMHTSTGKKGRLNSYHLTPDVEDFLTEFDDADVSRVVSRSSGAMMCPPERWECLTGGGYLSDRRKIAYPLMGVGRLRRDQRARVRSEFTAEKMPLVFATANYLQSIPFEIHAPTLAAVRRVWDGGGGVMGVCRKERPLKPDFPFPETWLKAEATPEELEVMLQWKRKASAHYDGLKKWRGHNREISGFIRVAAIHDGPVWFPTMMDTRGRWYYNGTPNPQGSDISKAALHLATKKPLGTRGLYWLRVAIANNYGFDKVPMDQRAQWTIDHWPTISAALDMPEDFPDVWGDDAPWCMFTAAWELREALKLHFPETYETGIPVHMDATCSGLQHFSAMLRDERGGKYVNLLPADGGDKSDIYAKVAADFAMADIKLDLGSTDPKVGMLAAWWMEQGMPRDLAKKPVMTYVYGATLRGTVDHIDMVMTKRGVKFPSDDIARPFDYQMYAAKKLFTGIELAVPAAAAAMVWLKQTARAMPKGQRMEWRTPTGFLVQHDYQDFDEVRVKLRSCGVTDIIVREANGDTQSLKMQNAIAPNFVHALDASHLSLTALAMQKAGLDMVGIHDSFGTHPCDVDTMHGLIRNEFVSMYQNTDVLGEFLWEVGGCGDKPERGNLQLEGVKLSEYFFS